MAKALTLINLKKSGTFSFRTEQKLQPRTVTARLPEIVYPESFLPVSSVQGRKTNSFQESLREVASFRDVAIIASSKLFFFFAKNS